MQSTPKSSGSRVIRTAIVGTGYIAEFHARAIRALNGVELVGVCDTNVERARSFAAQWKIPAAFGSLGSMLESLDVDCVHVLVPPDQHFAITRQALEAGAHVFVEKPMCASPEEADQLLEISLRKGRLIGVNHNFLFTRAYEKLRDANRTGKLGPLDYVAINYLFELGQIRSGPFDAWMIRKPGNVILETGPHLLSILLDLVGTPDNVSVAVDRKAEIPGGNHVFRRWRIHGTVGRAAIDITMNLGPGFSQRTIYARGLFGAARADLDANTCAIDRSPLTTDLNRYHRSRLLAKQFRSQGREMLADYVLSVLKIRRRGGPFECSILDSIAAFYSGLDKPGPLDNRIDGQFGRDVIAWCAKIIRAADIEGPEAAPALRKPAPKILANKPTVLVIGGSGFIGRELVQQLLASGYTVRAMARGSTALLDALGSDRLEVFRGDARSVSDLKSAMEGIEYVYDLATSAPKTWAEGLRDIVEPARMLGEVCLAADVKRLIYTGTIASYYAGAHAQTITEQTPLDGKIKRRNYYSRAKAAAEEILQDMHRTRGLPVVIFRPGIVIGKGGNPFHWGVGKFEEGSCAVWGDGNNKLPFVLVSDVASALVRGIQVPGIDGQSYNLVDIPLLNARDYIDALQRLAGISMTVRYRPIWRFYASDFFKWLVKLAVRHPDRIRVPSYHDWESRTHKAIFDCSRAREQLNWKPVSDLNRMIDEGVGGSLQAWLEACR